MAILVTFADLKYTEKNAGKTYTYLLQEAIPESKANGYTYDDTVYTVIVEVTDAGEGKLNVQKTIVKADESGELAPVDKAVFTNTYSAEGSITLTASKAYAEDVQTSTAGKSV